MVNDVQIRDAVIRHSLSILRLSAGEQQAAVEILRALAEQLRAMIAAKDVPALSKRELRALLKEAEDVISGAYGVLGKSVDTRDLADIVAGQARTILTKALPGVRVALPTADVLAMLATDVLIDGSPASAWWSKQADDTAFKFAGQVRHGVANGEPTAKIVQRIVGRRGEAGIMDVARRNALSLVHTSVQTVAEQSKLATYRRNDGLIKGVRQISTLDSHTSAVCIAYSGAAWDLDGKPIEGTTLPFNGGTPRHFGCRSTMVPITRSFRELGIDAPDLRPTTRASSFGQIDAGTSFDDFLKRQPAGFADQVLGKGRADLWRAGKITLRDLVSGTGRPLTLEELRKL